MKKMKELFDEETIGLVSPYNAIHIFVGYLKPKQSL